MSHRAIINIRLSNKEYVVNERTKEIHKLNNLKYQCFIDKIIDKTYINDFELPNYIINGYNGCRWCNSKYNTD